MSNTTMPTPVPTPIPTHFPNHYLPTIAPTPLFKCSNQDILSDSHVGLANNDWNVIRNSVLLYGSVGLILIIIFEIFRGKKSVFFRRTSKLKHRTPKVPKRLPFQWMLPVFQLSNHEVRKMVGLDGYVCIRYIMWCLKVCTFCSFWGLVVLIPLYVSGNQESDLWGIYTMNNIRDATAWNIDKNSHYGIKLWVSCAFNAIFTVYALFTINIEWKLYVKYRTEFLAHGDPDAKGGAQLAYSVRVEALPKELRSDLALYAYFDNLFPDQVHSAVVHLELGNLLSLIEKRQIACEKLESAIAQLIEKRLSIDHRIDDDDDDDDTNLRNLINNTSSKSLKSKEEPEHQEEAESEGKPSSIWIGDGPSSNETVKKTEANACSPLYKPIEGQPTAWFCCGGGLEAQDGETRYGCLRTVDAISYYRALLDELNEEVKREQVAVLAASNQVEESITARLRSKIKEVLKAEAGRTSSKSDSLYKTFQKTKKRSAEEDFKDDEDDSMIHQAYATSGKVVSGALKQGAQQALDDLGIMADGAILGIATVTRGLKILTVGEAKSSSAYVTFKTKQAAADARQVLLSKHILKMQILSAPDPRDLIWANATVGQREADTRSATTSLAVILFALMGFIPLLIAINSSGKFFVKIRQNKPTNTWFVDDDDDNDEESDQKLSSFDILLETQLPVILQVILVALLPLLFTFLSESYEKAKSQSQVQQSVLSRYYGFTLVNILSTFGVRNLLDVLKAIVKEPSCLVELLGRSIPGNASYFAQYVLVKTLTGLPLELCRIWPLIRVVWFQQFQRSGASRRAVALMQEETSEFCSGWIYPNFLLVIIVCISYAVIAPFLMLFGVAYFAFALVVYKHQLLFVYIPRYESGGALFATLYDYTLTGINFANLTMIGYGIENIHFSVFYCCILNCVSLSDIVHKKYFIMVLKQGYWQAVLLVFPLLLLVEYFRHYTSVAYSRQTEVLSREVAVEIDRRYAPRKATEVSSPLQSSPPPSAALSSRQEDSLHRTNIDSLSSRGDGTHDLSESSHLLESESQTEQEISAALSLSRQLAKSTSFRETTPFEFDTETDEDDDELKPFDSSPPYLKFDKNLYRQPALDSTALEPLPPKKAKRLIRKKRKAVRLAAKQKPEDLVNGDDDDDDVEGDDDFDEDDDEDENDEDDEMMMEELDEIEKEKNQNKKTRGFTVISPKSNAPLQGSDGLGVSPDISSPLLDEEGVSSGYNSTSDELV